MYMILPIPKQNQLRNIPQPLNKCSNPLSNQLSLLQILILTNHKQPSKDSSNHPAIKPRAIIKRRHPPSPLQPPQSIPLSHIIVRVSIDKGIHPPEGPLPQVEAEGGAGGELQVGVVGDCVAEYAV